MCVCMWEGEERGERRRRRGERGGEYMHVKSNWMCLQVEKGDFVAAERVLEQATEGNPHYLTACTSQLPLFFLSSSLSLQKGFWMTTFLSSRWRPDGLCLNPR